jgi:hypothetical protein
VKKLLPILMVLVLVGLSTNAHAVIGWAGNVYPNDGALITPTSDVTVYAQVWKSGVTDAAGQGADIQATLYYQTDTMIAQVPVFMSYNTDVGANDEYKGNIAQADLAGASWVDVTVVFDDLSDGTSFEVVGDQNGNPPLLRYTVTNVLPNDVDVTFQLCMSGETVTTGVPCVIGSAAEIGSWGTGVPMSNVSGELYEVTVTFLAGDNPSFEYKYRNNDCVDWESIGNRVVNLPTDGTATVTLDVDSWNDNPIGCGLGQFLSEDKVVCFQVCLDGVENTGGVCLTGGGALLTDWMQPGISMTMLGGGLYQACVTYPQGTAIPFNQEFKFQKDDCGTWETVPNRVLVIDDSLLPSQTVSYVWDDGSGFCAPVPNATNSWGALKAQY